MIVYHARWAWVCWSCRSAWRYEADDTAAAVVATAAAREHRCNGKEQVVHVEEPFLEAWLAILRRWRN